MSPGVLRRGIKKLLAAFPNVEKRLRKYRRLSVFFFYKRRTAAFHLDPQVTLLTPWDWAGVPAESGELFFGYYDKSPWSPNTEKMLLHFRKASSERRLQIRLFEKKERTCQTIAESKAWNFQQGAMTQWLHGSSSERIIFNDVVQNRLVSRIVSTDGKDESVVSFPIQTVHPNGREALSLNYRRLWEFRPDYGYSMDVENFTPQQSADRDGIWYVDLMSGKGGLIITLQQLLSTEPREGMNSVQTKVNHIIFSPTGKRCVFMHRWFNKHVKFSRLYIIDWDTKDFHLLLDTQMVSHYHWLDDEHLIIYGRTPDNQDTYFLINVVSGSYKTLDKERFERFGDGHPTFSPDRKWVVTDTYPDLGFKQHLLLYNTQKKRLKEVGSFIHSPKYFSTTRCDLHPRWSPDGKQVSIDSVWKGFRGSYILDVSSVVDANALS